MTPRSTVHFEVDYNGQLISGEVRGCFPIQEYETYDVIFRDGTIRHVEPVPSDEGYLWFSLSTAWQPLLSSIGKTLELQC